MSTPLLKGKRILLTRAEQQLPQLEAAVLARGALPVMFPCLELQSIDGQVAEALDSLDAFSDVLFTSVNGVSVVAAVCQQLNLPLNEALAGKRIAVVGEKTAQMLAASCVDVDVLPQLASQAGLITTYQTLGLPDKLLFFRAEEGSDELSHALKAEAVQVKTVPAYRTVCPQADASHIISMLESDAIDAVFLGSAKTARFYLQRLNSLELANSPVIVAISEKMAAEVRQLGLEVQVVAKSASFEAMLDALSEYLASNY